MAEDRNLLERAQDYLVSGDFDRDARYVLGPHLSKGLLGLAQLIGPGADIQAMVDESKRIIPSLKEGNVPGAVTSLGLAAVSPLLMGTPTDVGKIKKGTEKLIPQRLFHGTSNPDIKKFKFSKEGVLGEGVYLTPDPKYASTYATGDTANVIPVTADIKNPLVVQATNVEPSTDVLKALGVSPDKAAKITEKAFDDKGNITKEISARARKQGYDAVVLKNKDGNVQEIVSYKPDNISSAIGKKAEVAAQSGNKPYTQSIIGGRKKPVSEMKKNDSLVVPHLDDASKKLIQDDMGMGMHQLTTPVQEFTLVGGIVGNTGADGIGKVTYGVYDKDFNIIGRVVLRRKIGSTTSDDIDGLTNIEIDKPYRKKGYAKKILESLRASTDGKPLTIYDIENPKFFKNYGKKINKSRGGSVIERNPYNYSPKAIL